MEQPNVSTGEELTMFEDADGNEVYSETAANMLLNNQTVYLWNGFVPIGKVRRNKSGTYNITITATSAQNAIRIGEHVLRLT